MASYITICYFLATVICCCLSCQVNQPANPIQTITVTKGTSVRMQWVPSLQGCQLIGQQCGYLSGSSLIALAGKTRTGAFQAVSALPKQFAERVSAISSSHTLVIGNIQFNDTAYRFRCNVQAGFWISRGRSYPQNPTYNLQVVGKPEFMSLPPSDVVVEEGSTLRIVAMVSANPVPVVSFRWSRGTNTTVSQAVQQYPFVFKGTYEVQKIPIDYCGKRLSFKFTNVHGTSGERNISIRVLFRKDKQFYPEAKSVNSSCLQLSWQIGNTNECDVLYNLVLKSLSSATLYRVSVRNRSEFTLCNSGIVPAVALFSLSSSLGGNSTVFVKTRTTSPPTTTHSSRIRRTRKSTRLTWTTTTRIATDEKTTTMSTRTVNDEKTTTMSTRTVTDEKTTTMSTRTVTDEKTTTMSTRKTTDESTKNLRSSKFFTIEVTSSNSTTKHYKSTQTRPAITIHCESNKNCSESGKKRKGQQQQQQHFASSVVYIAFGLVIFILVIIIVCLLVWNFRLRGKRKMADLVSTVQKSSFSKKSAEDASEKGNTNYMDLKEIHEQPSYATLSERESYYENYQEGPFYENTFT